MFTTVVFVQYVLVIRWMRSSICKKTFLTLGRKKNIEQNNFKKKLWIRILCSSSKWQGNKFTSNWRNSKISFPLHMFWFLSFIFSFLPLTSKRPLGIGNCQFWVLKYLVLCIMPEYSRYLPALYWHLLPIPFQTNPILSAPKVHRVRHNFKLHYTIAKSWC